MLKNNSKFFFVILLFLAVRFLIVLTSTETIIQGEEFYRGTIAKEILSGENISLSDYQHDSYVGGTFVVSFLAAFFFLLLGPTLFSLKLAPLILSLVALLITLLMLKRYFGEKAALYGGMLLSLCPTVVTTTTLVGLGNHADSFFISVVMLFLFWEYMRLERRGIIPAFLLGLVAAVGYWFVPTTALTFIAIVITCLWVYPASRWGRYAFIVLFGLLVGSIPFWMRNLSQGFASFEFLEHLFVSGNQSSSWMDYLSSKGAKFSKILFLGIPLGMFPGLGSKMFGVILSAFYFLILIFVILSNKKDLQKTRFFLVFILTHVFIYTISAQHFFWDRDAFTGGRILSPLFFFLLIWGAIAIGRTKRPLLFLIPLLLLSAIGQASTLFREPVGRIFEYKGYSYLDLGELWGGSDEIIEQDQEMVEKVLERLPEPDRRYLLWSYATTKDPSPYYSVAAIRKLPANYQSYVLEGWGYELGADPKVTAEQLQEIAKDLPDESHSYFHRGLMLGAVAQGFKSPQQFAALVETGHLFWFELGSSLYRPAKELNFDDFLKDFDLTQKQWFWRGLGKGVGMRCLNNSRRLHSSCYQVLQSASELAETNIYWGIGWGWGEFYKEDPVRAWDQLRWLSGDLREAAQKGLESCLKWYGLNVPGD